ncbi:hypothetical protein KKC83_04780 [Patescibacteria group bacterium]|nr:hypothetical protein [Patescibacteria group bacterium]MBU4015047.1 hypothetical protein [Patescibacteria group bacterium]MBU4026832.1 hypothetical protein [Patescibacteria group bacterium]MBU4073357.1 hypothetical protein [Patescibacteria group bacterium]MBU4102428.1 hypothetical protein [Patescibacteria group bacterium]
MDIVLYNKEEAQGRLEPMETFHFLGHVLAAHKKQELEKEKKVDTYA